MPTLPKPINDLINEFLTNGAPSIPEADALDVDPQTYALVTVAREIDFDPIVAIAAFTVAIARELYNGNLAIADEVFSDLPKLSGPRLSRDEITKALRDVA